MKRKIFTLIVALCYIISGCTTYKPFMSNATENPIEQKLPKMEVEWGKTVVWICALPLGDVGKKGG